MKDNETVIAERLEFGLKSSTAARVRTLEEATELADWLNANDAYATTTQYMVLGVVEGFIVGMYIDRDELRYYPF